MAPLSILVLSGTVDEERWRRKFGDRVCVRDDKEEDITVYCCGWREISITSYADSGLQVSIHRKGQNVWFKPTLVLIRSVVWGVPRGSDSGDYRHILYGFAHAGIPCVNSAHSEILMLHRPVVHGALLDLKRRLGKDVFNVVDQIYCPDHTADCIGAEYPAVVKVGHVHAGYGKTKVSDHKAMEEVVSLLSLHTDYYTTEEFIPHTREMRVQKIGDRYRCFTKVSMGGWKSNAGAGSTFLEDAEMTPKYKRWVDECSRLFGGLDMLAVDAVVQEDTGEEIILELNGGAIGLMPDHEEEDEDIIVSVVLNRLREHFTCGPTTTTDPTTESLATTVSELKNQVDELNGTVRSQVAELESVRQRCLTLRRALLRRVAWWAMPVVVVPLAAVVATACLDSLRHALWRRAEDSIYSTAIVA